MSKWNSLMGLTNIRSDLIQIVNPLPIQPTVIVRIEPEGPIDYIPKYIQEYDLMDRVFEDSNFKQDEEKLQKLYEENKFEKISYEFLDKIYENSISDSVFLTKKVKEKTLEITNDIISGKITLSSSWRNKKNEF